LLNAARIKEIEEISGHVTKDINLLTNDPSLTKVILWAYTINNGFGSTRKIEEFRSEWLELEPEFLLRMHALLPTRVLEEARSEIERAKGLGIKVISINQAEYPQSLLEIPDPPLVLFVKGELCPSRRIAIVGARNCSSYGYNSSFQIAKACTRAGLCVVSGLAKGIDAAAHRGAIDSTKSNTSELRTSGIAVVGTGIDISYPLSNRTIADELLANRGAIISEFGLGRRGRKYYFPRRNRIISGLSSGIIVVEAMCNSGSLITAQFGLEQGKDIFAVPGEIFSPMSEGCHKLIESGAYILRSPEQLLEHFGQVGMRAKVIYSELEKHPIIKILEERGECEFSQLLADLHANVPFLKSELAKLELLGQIGIRANSRIFLRN
jgi:DNA protecting protein DprA